MSEVFNIQITGPLPEGKSRMADPDLLARTLLRVMDQQNLLTVSHIQERYMSFPSGEPPTLDGLRVISNRLRGSVNASAAEISGSGVSSSIGSNVIYAAIHEFGGDTAPHDIVARNAKALRFTGAGGETLFRRSVHHPGSHMPARAPIQRGIKDRLPEYRIAFETALQKALN